MERGPVPVLVPQAEAVIEIEPHLVAGVAGGGARREGWQEGAWCSHVARVARAVGSYGTFSECLECFGCIPPPQATRTDDNEVAGLAEWTLRAVAILRPSWCFFVASTEFMGCKKANTHTNLASRQTGNHREVAAYLPAANSEGREK